MYGLPNLLDQEFFLAGRIFINIMKDTYFLQNAVCRMLLNHHNTWDSLNFAHVILIGIIYVKKAPILKKIFQGTYRKEAIKDRE